MTTPWQPSRVTTILLGVITIWPIVYFVLFAAFLMFTFATIGTKPQGATFDLFRYVFVLHLLTILLMFALTTVYIVHAFRTDRIAEDKRVLWVVILFFGDMIAFPIRQRPYHNCA
jgi:hypothetical protein